VRNIGLEALSESMRGSQKKTKILKLNIFHEQKAKAKRAQSSNAGKTDEIAALLRMAQLVASGSNLDINNFIGNHECSQFSLSLFTDDGSMRSAGTKSTLVKSLKEETKVKTTTHLPLEPRKTAVIIDAMFANDSGLSGKASHLGQ